MQKNGLQSKYSTYLYTYDIQLQLYCNQPIIIYMLIVLVNFFDVSFQIMCLFWTSRILQTIVIDVSSRILMTTELQYPVVSVEFCSHYVGLQKFQWCSVSSYSSGHGHPFILYCLTFPLCRTPAATVASFSLCATLSVFTDSVPG